MPVKVLAKWGSMLVTGFAMLFGGVALTPVVQPWNIPMELSAGALGAFAAIVLVGTCAAYMLYLQGVNDCGPVKAGLLCAAEPVSAMVLAVVWLRDPVSAWDIAGCICILLMIVMVTELKPKAAPAPVAADVAGVEAPAYVQDLRCLLAVHRCLATTKVVLPPWTISSACKRCLMKRTRRMRSSGSTKGSIRSTPRLAV